MYIAIAGNIGSGKTTLTEMLGRHYEGSQCHYETPDNPYIDDFYEDMNRWAFNLQIYFLAARIEQTKQVLDLRESTSGHIIQDRTIYEDARIFAANLGEMGLITSRDLQTYMKSFNLFASFIPRPDLLIYLSASVDKLKEQIIKRGRSYESNIDEEYLHRLNDRYNEWIESYDGEVIRIDVDSCNFEDNADLFKQICEQIDSRDNG
ncbi:MAG: deoxynucleoside kinase [Rikenellaceae bacterium]